MSKSFSHFEAFESKRCSLCRSFISPRRYISIFYVLAHLNLLRGLVIYPQKSIFLSQKIVFLEFISSKKITQTLNDENKIKNEGTNNDSLPKQ